MCQPRWCSAVQRESLSGQQEKRDGFSGFDGQAPAFQYIIMGQTGQKCNMSSICNAEYALHALLGPCYCCRIFDVQLLMVRLFLLLGLVVGGAERPHLTYGFEEVVGKQQGRCRIMRHKCHSTRCLAVPRSLFGLLFSNPRLPAFCVTTLRLFSPLSSFCLHDRRHLC